MLKLFNIDITTLVTRLALTKKIYINTNQFGNKRITATHIQILTLAPDDHLHICSFCKWIIILSLDIYWAQHHRNLRMNSNRVDCIRTLELSYENHPVRVIGMVIVVIVSKQ